MPVERYEIVIVSYFSRQQVSDLFAHTTRDQRVVVVDNASGADGVPDLVQTLAHGRWVDGRNSGFARAANMGARTSTADFLIFVNPDSRPTVDVLQALLAEIDADPQLAVAAAATTDQSGRIELGVAGWEPTLLRCLVYATGLHRIYPRAGVYAQPTYGEQIDAEWITGACMAVRRSTFLALGGFDERYFVYNEDMSFGRQVRRAGLRLKLRTDLLVRHEAGGSGGGTTKMPQQRGVSMAEYLHHHHTDAAARTMRAVLAAGILGRAVVAGLLGQRERMRKHGAYLYGIATRRSPYASDPGS